MNNEVISSKVKNEHDSTGWLNNAKWVDFTEELNGTEYIDYLNKLEVIETPCGDNKDEHKSTTINNHINMDPKEVKNTQTLDTSDEMLSISWEHDDIFQQVPWHLYSEDGMNTKKMIRIMT